MTQRRRRWFNIVQMLYNFFVFAGIVLPCEVKSREQPNSYVTSIRYRDAYSSAKPNGNNCFLFR